MADGSKNPIDVLGESVAELHNVQIERVNKLQNDLFHVARLQLDTAMKAIEDHRNAVIEAFTHKANASDVNELAKARSLQMAAIAKELDQHRYNTKHAIDSVNEAIKKVKDTTVDSSSHADDYANLMTKIAEIKGYISCNREEAARINFDIKTYIDKKIEEVRSEFASKPSELAAFRDDLEQKLSAIATESRNADEISKKTLQKHFILDKKIESAVYLLQKLGMQL